MTTTSPGWGLCDEYRAARDTLATRITLGQVPTRSTLEQELCTTLNGLTALTVCHLGGAPLDLPAWSGVWERQRALLRFDVLALWRHHAA